MNWEIINYNFTLVSEKIKCLFLKIIKFFPLIAIPRCSEAGAALTAIILVLVDTQILPLSTNISR